MTHRVLVIDDDDLLRESVCIALRDAGYQTFDHGDGNAALPVARRERPHLILLDIMMPGFDGFAVLNVLRMDPLLKKTPVIMLTGVRQETDVRRASELGVAAYVVKPIDNRALIARVKSALVDQNAPNPVAWRVQGVEWLD